MLYVGCVVGCDLYYKGWSYVFFFFLFFFFLIITKSQNISFSLLSLPLSKRSVRGEYVGGMEAAWKNEPSGAGDVGGGGKVWDQSTLFMYVAPA